MSARDAQLFLEGLAGDASLRAQLLSMGIVDAESIADFALSKGYVITGEDLKSALSTFPPSAVIDLLRERLKMPKGVHST